MSLTSLPDNYINTIVSHVAEKLELIKWKYFVEKFESIGQNYFGVVVPVTLQDCNKEKNKILKIVLKLAPTDKRYRVSGAVAVLFQKEIFVYSVLLEKFRVIQQQLLCKNKLFKPFIIPIVFFARDEYEKEVIVLQNMCTEGYQPYTIESFLDLDHIIVALDSLARFHALSFLIKETDEKLYQEMCIVCLPLTKNTNKRYLEVMKDRLQKAAHHFTGTKYVPLLERLYHNCCDIFDGTIEQTKKTCIGHGDAWKENILFKYEGTKPVSACLIDYQMTRLVCPAYDTLYLIISSTNAQTREEHYYELLDKYYNTFDEMLQSSGLNSQEVYSKESFNNDLKVVAPACLITANCALWLSNGLQEEGYVRSKIVWKTPEEKTVALNKYKTIVKSIIEDYYTYGYLPESILNSD